VVQNVYPWNQVNRANARPTQNLGSWSTLAALTAIFPAAAVPIGSFAYTGDEGPVYSTGSAWTVYSSGGGGGVGASINYAAPTGTIDPAITGFQAGLGSSGTRIIKATLTGNTSLEGLPAGVPGQSLSIVVVSGAFTLTLLHQSGATTQQPIYASGDIPLALGDCTNLVADSTLGWILIV
jgi:hypothetical protein